MKNKKSFAIASLVLSITSIVLYVFGVSESLKTTMIVVGISACIAIVGIVLGVIGRKEGKGFSIAGIIIGVLSFILLSMTLLSLYMLKEATNCVETENGTAICELLGTEVEIPINYLNEEQKRGKK